MRDPETWEAEKASGVYSDVCDVCGNQDEECTCYDPFENDTMGNEYV